jgi:hypothetical protein
MKIETVTMDREFPFWVIAEYEPGKRVTKDMITFDTNRRDVHVNKYGVVLFYNTDTALMLLEKDFGVDK